MMVTSKIIAGCMNWGNWGVKFSTQQYLKQIEANIELGVTTFDHADIYGEYTTESQFGQALKLYPSLRDKIQLITKCGICLVSEKRPLHQIKSYNTSKTHILESVHKSLENLQTDYIDLLLIHRPDPLMDPQEIAEAFFLLKESGKVKHIGVSNFSSSQLTLLLQNFKIEVNQIEASILHTRPFYDGTTDKCIENNIHVQAWSPLAAGRISIDSHEERIKRIISMALILGNKYGASYDQILLSWLMKHPSKITPIIGTTKIQRVQNAVKSLEINLTREEWHLLLRAANGFDVP